VRLGQAGIGADAFTALDQGRREAALDGLLDELGRLGEANGETPENARDLVRQAFVGILSEDDQADPSARQYRRKLAAALG
jgi:thioredoxin-like negative regulator of GroEL